MSRAKATGRLRPDFSPEDLAMVLIANAGVVNATGDAAPGTWRRLVAYFIQAFAAEAAQPLPDPPTPGRCTGRSSGSRAPPCGECVLPCRLGRARSSSALRRGLRPRIGRSGEPAGSPDRTRTDDPAFVSTGPSSRCSSPAEARTSTRSVSLFPDARLRPGLTISGVRSSRNSSVGGVGCDAAACGLPARACRPATPSRSGPGSASRRS
jgi:hypothetical protein